jgi:predicted N-acetyltransferase YhbS
LKIRKSTESDKTEIKNIHIKAFGEQKGPEIAYLVNDLIDDKTATPLLSLVAVEDEKLITCWCMDGAGAMFRHYW